MKLVDFDYFLPPERIARYPLNQRRDSRLLCLNTVSQSISHSQFPEILYLIDEGDLLVFNDTKVIPARLIGNRKTGGKVEVFVERILDEHRILAQVRASKSLPIGEKLYFAQDTSLIILDKRDQFFELQSSINSIPIVELIELIGQIPLPPYLHRIPEEQDKDRYQTIYAKHKGSVAAPTAGFHFDQNMLSALVNKGVNMGYLTLHIGAGTFSPVRVDEIKQHHMHAEFFEVSEELCELIRLTKAKGHRVISVGTTTLRALEAASQSGETLPFRGETNIFIYPSYQFHSSDALITNLHLPRSTLLMLVCAFGGYDLVMRAYREAVDQSYRFYSYGDAMWINRK